MIFRDKLGRVLKGSRKEFCKRGHFRSQENLNKAGACKKCEKLMSLPRQKKWEKENPEKRRAIVRKYRKNARLKNPDMVKNWDFKGKYGISIKDKQDIFQKQGENCAICKTTNPGRKGWNMDHDHKTGKNRGVLCLKCNCMLGYVQDDISILKKAIDYLEKYKVIP